MGLSKRGISLNLTLVVSFIIILGLASFAFAAVVKYNPVSIDSEPESELVEEQPETVNVTINEPVSEPIQIEEEPIKEINSDSSANCGDAITTNTVLTADLLNCPGNGIVIGANNIVLDCQNHKINGISVGSGVSAIGKLNIIVRNCKVDNFGYGFYFDSTNNSLLLNNEANNNSVHGFWLWQSSSNNILISNIAMNNTQAGFALHSFSGNNSFDSNLAQLNKRFGFHLSNSPDNTFTLNIARNNKKSGFQFDHLADNISASSNIAENNLEYGFLLTSSDYDLLTSNRVINNSLAGIHLQNSQGPPVGNLIYNNFFNNTLNAIDAGTNYWNITKTPGLNIVNGPNIGGNFWSDYNGTDTDGDGLDELFSVNTSTQMVHKFNTNTLSWEGLHWESFYLGQPGDRFYFGNIDNEPSEEVIALNPVTKGPVLIQRFTYGFPGWWQIWYQDDGKLGEWVLYEY